jgi:hypothetical protein
MRRRPEPRRWKTDRASRVGASSLGDLRLTMVRRGGRAVNGFEVQGERKGYRGRVGKGKWKLGRSARAGVKAKDNAETPRTQRGAEAGGQGAASQDHQACNFKFPISIFQFPTSMASRRRGRLRRGPPSARRRRRRSVSVRHRRFLRNGGPSGGARRQRQGKDTRRRGARS